MLQKNFGYNYGNKCYFAQSMRVCQNWLQINTFAKTESAQTANGGEIAQEPICCITYRHFFEFAM